MDITLSFRPPVAIFLDIHGVFGEYIYYKRPLDPKISAKFVELFGKKTIKNDTPKNRAIVHTHFFAKKHLSILIA